MPSFFAKPGLPLAGFESGAVSIVAVSIRKIPVMSGLKGCRNLATYLKPLILERKPVSRQPPAAVTALDRGRQYHPGIREEYIVY